MPDPLTAPGDLIDALAAMTDEERSEFVTTIAEVPRERFIQQENLDAAGVRTRGEYLAKVDEMNARASAFGIDSRPPEQRTAENRWWRTVVCPARLRRAAGLHRPSNAARSPRRRRRGGCSQGVARASDDRPQLTRPFVAEGRRA